MVVIKSLSNDYMYRKIEFLYMLRRNCIKISDFDIDPLSKLFPTPVNWRRTLTSFVRRHAQSLNSLRRRPASKPDAC